MSGLVNSLHIGASSLLTSQKAIEITGGNIANVNTPGYSRQVPVLSNHPALVVRGVHVGQGVRIDEVQRQYDRFLSLQIGARSATLGGESSRTQPLAEVERLIGVGESGLAAEIGRFFDAWQGLGADPGNSALRDEVVRRGETLALAFRRTAGGLQQVREGINSSLEAKIGEVNTRLQEVAELNRRIAGIEVTGQNALADRDRRDVLLAELAALVGASHFEEEGGMVAVMGPGGVPLVQGTSRMTLEGVRGGGDVQLYLRLKEGSVALGPLNTGGELGGLLQVRDGLLPGVQAEIDQLAYALATEVNARHRLGVGADGTGSRDFFASPAAAAGAAAGLAVALQAGNQVAAGTTAAAGDNRTALALAALGQEPAVNGTDTFVDFYARLASRVGAEVRQNRLDVAGGEDALVQLQNRRDALAGVSVEEEMVNLIRFQRSFEASAKFLSTVDELMESLLAIRR